MRRRCALVGALLLLGLATPASADAATIFGSDLTLPPIPPPAPECTGPGTGPCTDIAFSFHTGNQHPATAPVGGVITSVRYRSSTADTVTLRLARLALMQDATGAGTGPTATLQPTGQITEVPVNPGLPVQAGDYLAGDGSTGTTFNCSPGAGATASFHLYLPPLVDGGPFRPRTTQNACEILVQATIEADADGDRLGDESQDNCQGLASPDTLDTDGDALGDVCDPDDDNDAVADTADNCPLTANSSQANADGDALGDACDAANDSTPELGSLLVARTVSGTVTIALPAGFPAGRANAAQKGLTFIPLEQGPGDPRGLVPQHAPRDGSAHLGHDHRRQDPVGQLLAWPLPGAAVVRTQGEGADRPAAQGLELQPLPSRPLGLGRAALAAHRAAPARKRARPLPHDRAQQLCDRARHGLGGRRSLRRDADEGQARQGRGARLRRQRNVIVRAGKSYLARPAR